MIGRALIACTPQAASHAGLTKNERRIKPQVGANLQCTGTMRSATVWQRSGHWLLVLKITTPFTTDSKAVDDTRVAVRLFEISKFVLGRILVSQCVGSACLAYRACLRVALLAPEAILDT